MGGWHGTRTSSSPLRSVCAQHSILFISLFDIFYPPKQNLPRPHRCVLSIRPRYIIGTNINYKTRFDSIPPSSPAHVYLVIGTGGPNLYPTPTPFDDDNNNSRVAAIAVAHPLMMHLRIGQPCTMARIKIKYKLIKYIEAIKTYRSTGAFIWCCSRHGISAKNS